jgi:membrane-bound lytic murein transglycosylase A
MVDLGEFRPELKGQRIAGRVADGRLRPYEERAKIVAGKLPAGQDVPLLWVDDPVDAFFLEIQGSGRVLLDDGSTVRVGFDGQNGQVYYAVGRELVKRGLYTKDEVSMQTIRAFMAAHPGEAQELMNLNKSYVFFKTLEGDGPIGGQGAPLTPGRSLAIDHGKLPYGVPVYVDAAPELRQLMVTQDTGGAITGAVRGDVFFGYGKQAEERAGKMKARGKYWLLLPKN